MAGQVEALRRAGRMDDAIALLRAQLARAPDDGAAWIWLGDTLAAANRPDLALDAFGRALKAGATASLALGGKARALAALGRPVEAAEAFRAALERDAADPGAHYGLALLAFQGGDMDSASAHLARVGETAPAADWLAARVALARGALGQAQAAADRMLQRPDLDPLARADALLLKAEVLDRLGDWRAAFAAAAEGKAIQRRSFSARAAQHESEVAKLQRLAAWFAGADRAAWAEPAPGKGSSEALGHVFLLGFPRSGTTLLEQALAGHARIVTLEEAPTLAETYQAFLASPEGLARLASLSEPEADHWRARYWASVRAHGVEPRGRVLLDKAPAATLNLPLIAKLFPEAKVLFAVRDPRDIVLSCLMNAFQMNALTYAFTDLVETARCYAACMTLAETYRAILPLRLMDVRHEALAGDFAAGLADIAAFVGVELQPAMEDIARTAQGRVVRTPSASQVRAGLSTERFGRWRNYAAELAPVLAILAPWAARFGYPAA